MSVKFQFEEKPYYLVVRFVDAGSSEEVWMQFESIAERCKRMNINRPLFDFTAAYPKPSITDRYSGRRITCNARL
jgi:hypothetical protein